MPRLTRLLRAALIAATALSTSACGTYLHDPALQADTAEVKSAFVALKAPAAFTDQRKRLEAFAAREDATVAEYSIAQRDWEILNLVRPSPEAAAAKDSVERLREFVRAELITTFGLPEPPAPPQPPPKDVFTPELLNGIAKASELYLNYDQAIANARAGVLRSQAIYIERRAKDDDRGESCADVLNIPPDPGATQPDPYARLAAECRNLVFTERKRPTELALAQGQLGDVLAAIKASDERRDKAEKQARELKAKIKALLDAQEDAPPGSAPQLDDLFNDVVKLLDDAEPIAKVAGFEKLSDVLEPALKIALGSADAQASDDPTTRKAAAVLKMLRATAKTVDAFSAEPNIERGQALLIGIAELRHRQNIAKLDADVEVTRRRILEAQQTALTSKAGRLAQAYLTLAAVASKAPEGLADMRKTVTPQDRTRISRAFGDYVAAWDEGEAPFRVLQYREVQLRRLQLIDRDTIVEADYRAVLAPAIDQMAAYGEGGVKVELIANLIGRLGLAAAILGE